MCTNKSFQTSPKNARCILMPRNLQNASHVEIRKRSLTHKALAQKPNELAEPNNIWTRLDFFIFLVTTMEEGI